jgi:thiol-disulfide isomerase/thioredoxin
MKKRLVFAMLVLALASSCATTPSGKLKYIELYTRNCNICNRMAPVLEAASSKYGNLLDVESYSTSLDTGEELQKKYNIKKFPANLFLDGQGALFFRYEGLLDQKSVEEIMERKIRALGLTRTGK